MSGLGSYNTLNTPTGQAVTLVASAIVLWRLISEIRAIAMELSFYKSNHWDMTMESGNSYWPPNSYGVSISYWPNGFTKLVILGVRALAKLSIVLFLLYGAFLV